MTVSWLQPYAPVCVIAGRGNVPVRICEALSAAGVLYRVLAVKDHAMDGLAVDAEFEIDKCTPVLEYFREWSIVSLIFAGKVDRPNILSLRPDKTLLKYLPRLGLAHKGDDGVMQALLQIFQEDLGLQILSPQQILFQGVRAEGFLGTCQAKEQDEADIVRGVEALRSLSGADFGQTIAVAGGVVLAIEAIEGTDEMITRAGEYRRIERGGVIVKMPKVQQDNRIDAPTLGTETIHKIHQAGFGGIAISAENTLIIDQDDVIALADKLGVFIRVVG